MHKNFYGYEKGNVETRYNVEFIDDPKTWDWKIQRIHRK